MCRIVSSLRECEKNSSMSLPRLLLARKQSPPPRRGKLARSIAMFNYSTRRFTVRRTFRYASRLVLIADWREHLSAVVHAVTRSVQWETLIVDGVTSRAIKPRRTRRDTVVGRRGGVGMRRPKVSVLSAGVLAKQVRIIKGTTL